jgi:hypothetical protein
MWPSESPPLHVADLSEVPEEARPYYQSAASGGFVLRDMLDHVSSVHTPECLKRVYQIRQYSHRRTAFLKRELLSPGELALLPSYPDRLEDYRRRPEADQLHTDLLYTPQGDLYEEFHALWRARATAPAGA